MPIYYSVIENTLPDGRKVWRARVHPARLVPFEEVVERVAKGKTTVSKADTLGVCAMLFEVMGDLLVDGCSISTPWGVYQPSVQGTFADASDFFDPLRHQVTVSIAAGPQLREMMKTRARAERVPAEEAKPYLTRYDDCGSGRQNSIVTPGDDGVLVGSGLKFDPTDPQQGIFFVAADGSEVRVEKVSLRRPTTLVFHVPALAPGPYHVLVRVRPRRCPEIRKDIFNVVLTVPGEPARSS